MKKRIRHHRLRPDRDATGKGLKSQAKAAVSRLQDAGRPRTRPTPLEGAQATFQLGPPGDLPELPGSVPALAGTRADAAGAGAGSRGTRRRSLGSCLCHALLGTFLASFRPWLQPWSSNPQLVPEVRSRRHVWSRLAVRACPGQEKGGSGAVVPAGGISLASPRVRPAPPPAPHGLTPLAARSLPGAKVGVAGIPLSLSRNEGAELSLRGGGMVWIKETKKHGEVSKNKTLRFPFRRLRRRRESAKVQPRCAPRGKPSVDARRRARSPGGSRRAALSAGGPWPAV